MLHEQRHSWDTRTFYNEDNITLQVVCRQLGLVGGMAHSGSHYGQGSGQIWLKNLQCVGTEARLADCTDGGNYQSHISSCFHYEDSSVTCAGMMDIVRLNSGDEEPVMSIIILYHKFNNYSTVAPLNLT